MAPTYDDAPEVAGGHDLPEAYVSQHPEQVWSPQPSIAPTYTSQTPVSYGNTGTYSDATKGAVPGMVGGVVGDAATYSTAPESTYPEKKAAATVGGISLVLLLSIIIAILSVAVIGLAAGTGVATKNYNDANSKLKVLSSALAEATNAPTHTPAPNGSPTSSGGGPSSTPDNWNSLTNGCSTNGGDVTGLTYTSPFFGQANFTMYCNKDAPNAAMYSVFATNFNGCMDACAGWNTYNKTTSGTCVAVSFIPSWSIASNAKAGNAPGDCYLKPGPQKVAKLNTPNIGTECHAAILQS
ncbi:hypothetical protein TARUN_4166 [Trichoderma arundinaceum]|uniref:Uncharacterized protein n=1 Tax=Trichoderma arundinaceum TaxID=490622 RepID=A0A395NQ43_TRIAR|nr:hypothetical protein TARUN_4166 [Trichoderma arundinaceum]